VKFRVRKRFPDKMEDLLQTTGQKIDVTAANRALTVHAHCDKLWIKETIERWEREA